MLPRNKIQQEISISPKVRLRQLNEEQFENFILSDRVELTLQSPSLFSFWPFNRIFGSTIIYKKTTITVGNGNQVVVINKNDEPDFFTWQTDAEQLSKGVRYGICKPQSFTGKVLYALGGYHKKVFERAYENGILSNKSREKEALLTIAQDRVEFTQPLECLVNSYDESVNPSQNQERVVRTLKKYKEILSDYKLGENVELLKQYNQAAIDEIQGNIEADIEEINKIILRLELSKESKEIGESPSFLLEDFLCPTGSYSIMAFVKTRALHAIRHMQKLNQDISYNVNLKAYRESAISFLRGDLHSAGEDAINEFEDYKAYHNDPILPAHQGHYPHSKKLSMSFASLGRNRSAIHKTLMAISQIEGDDEIDKLSSTLISKEHNSVQLEKTSRTKFADYGPNSDVSQWSRLGRGVINILVGIVKVVFGLIYGFCVGVINDEIPAISKQLRFKEVDNKRFPSKYDELASKLQVSTESELGGFKIGHTLGWFFFRQPFEVIKGATLLVKKVFYVTFFQDIRADFFIGKNDLREEDILKDIEKKVDAIKVQTKELNALLNKEHKENFGEDLFNGKQLEECKYQQAKPLFDLTYKHSVGSAAVGVARSLALTLPRAVPKKHPGLGAILASFGLLGKWAYSQPDPITPHTVADYYVIFTKKWAASMVSHSQVAGMTTGFTQGQALSAIAELIIHGRKSWIVDFLQKLESNPDEIVLMVSTVLFGGKILTQIEDIPLLGSIPVAGPFLKWLGEDILHAMGDGPLSVLTLLTFTAKIGLIFYELLEARELSEQNFSDEELFEQAKEKFESSDACFLLKLKQSANHLPHLDYQTKRELEELTYRRFKDKPEIVNAVAEMLHPPESHSAVVATFSDLADVISKALRMLVCPVTGYTRSAILFFQAAKNFIVQDVLSPPAELLHVAFTAARTFCHWAGDLVFNAFLGRLASFIGNLHHSISKLTYGFSAWFDATYEKWRQVSSQPIDVARKSMGHTSSAFVLEEMLKRGVGERRQHKQIEKVRDTVPATTEGLGLGVSLQGSTDGCRPAALSHKR